MRKTTGILFVVLVISAVVMVAGLLLGPDTAGSAFFVISVWLGAYVAHRGGRQDRKPEVVKPWPRRRGITSSQPMAHLLSGRLDGQSV